VRAHYADFGPTLACEYLPKEHGLKIRREKLRQLLTAGGLWEPKPRKLNEVHQWRPRRSCWGELSPWDTSVHAWLETRGPSKMYLIAGIDDATNRLFARFVPADSTEQHMRVLWAYCGAARSSAGAVHRSSQRVSADASAGLAGSSKMPSDAAV
jgi:hypothetical protein